MHLIIDTQVNIDLFSDQNGYRFEHEGQHHVLSSMDKVHAFFQKQPFDTVKLCHDGKKSYVHFSLDDVEVFDSKKALRKTISQENGGSWIEEKEGKNRYFVDDSGWFQTSFKQVSKNEFHQKLDSPSTLQKVLGIGLGILALLPGALEIKERLPFGASEAGMGFLALQQKSPLLGALGYSFLPRSVEAQAMGTEFQVNTFTDFFQWYPIATPLNDGGFVVVWESGGQDGSASGVYGQRYHASGTLSGPEFQINTNTTSNQASPKAAPLIDGGFVVTWVSYAQDGNQNGIFAQMYDSSGMPNGSEFQVNTYTRGAQSVPAVAPLSDGGFVFTWMSYAQDSGGMGIYGQRYNASGSPNGSEFLVNSYTMDDQRYPSAASLNNEGFVIVWQSDGQDGSKYGIYGQRYHVTGLPNGSEFQVNTYVTNSQMSPSVAPLRDGGFVVVWESGNLWESGGQDGDLAGIYGQRYNASGSKNGLEFQVNTYVANSQIHPSVASLNDGGFVIIWTSEGQDGDLAGIYGQRYNASGLKNSSEFQVNTYVTNSQQHPSVAPLNNGGFVVVWDSLDQDGDHFGLFGQRYDQNGNPVPVSTVIPISSATTNFTNSQLSLTSSSNTENDAISSSPPGFGIPPLIDVVYGDSYPIIYNGQTIGTFTISGGTGLYSGSNPNTLNIEIDPDIVLQDGDTVTLFSVPEGEEPQWEGVTFLNSDGCFNAEGELVQNEENNGNKYQVIFSYEGESCSIYGDASKLGAIPVLTSGGLI